MDELVFSSRYVSLSFYWVGWKWSYAIMKIIDLNNAVKNRLFKCKMQDNFSETTMYKSIEEMETCFSVVREEFNELNSIKRN